MRVVSLSRCHRLPVRVPDGISVLLKATPDVHPPIFASIPAVRRQGRADRGGIRIGHAPLPGARACRRSAGSRLGALLLATIAGGCAGDSPPREQDGFIEVVDDIGHMVRLSAPARRVVSLIPGRTDVILALGAQDRLVARTHYDADQRIAHLPSLGDALTPSVEWLAVREPDLVIAWPDRQSRSVVTRLEDLGIPVYASNVESIEGARKSIVDIGALLGLRPRADSLVGRLDAVLDSIRTLTVAAPRPTVLYLIGLDPPQAAGPGTFIDEMIDIAGGVNALSDATALWPSVSVEDVLARQPHIIIVSTATAAPHQVIATLRSQPGWRDMSAVVAGRLHVVDASVMNRPGPALIDAVRILAVVIDRS
jgi:iron complex transport system substrate-binding protein